MNKSGLMADRPNSGFYGEEYFATDFMQTYVWNGEFWTSTAAFDAQQKRERKERDRREFEREKREHPWWYENGHTTFAAIWGDIECRTLNQHQPALEKRSE